MKCSDYTPRGLAASNRFETDQKIWNRLGELYGAARFLSDFDVDMRRLRAAELVVAAWKACSTNPEFGDEPKPQWIVQLEIRISQADGNGANSHTAEKQQYADVVPEEGATFSDILGLDFENIEWSYWQ